GAQMIEMHRFSQNGDEARLHFSDAEGTIPTADALSEMGIKLFVGVGHETTGATTYTVGDIANLLEWIDRDPANHHAIIDATSMLGAMPWPEEMVAEFMSKCCMFMPFQKAIGGISGYLVASLTPEAMALIEANQQNPAWAIPRQLKIVVPNDPKRPLTGEKSTALGPIYDPAEDRMQGGIINTYSTLAFAETTFGLQRSEKIVGPVSELNKRSMKNRQTINEWVAANPLFELGVANEERRGAAVTLLRVNDSDITDGDVHARIINRSKQLLAYEGLTHPNGDREPGLDVARYVNAFPGTPGDYRAWIGGIRPHADITALLENLQYAYRRAKIVVLEELLAEQGEAFASSQASAETARKDDPNRAYKVLVADLVGLKFDADGAPDHGAVRAHIEAKGGVFHEGPMNGQDLENGKIHFFYQPDLSTEAEILPQTEDGQYDALIAAATFIPAASRFAEGGVRIGAGTGNMGSASWGGGNGAGGEAPLMNTPSFNSRATAHMTLKALLKTSPDLPVDRMHDLVVAGDFDTGKQLKDFPTEKLEGKRMAVIGYGNIGREVAKLAKAFNMSVSIYARPQHRDWIESEGFEYAETPAAAASGADFISPHTGLGAACPDTGRFANADLVNEDVLDALNDGAVVVNYDRGEVVCCTALDKALSSGKVRYAGIDADLFKCSETGTLSGPMVPYLDVEKKHAGKLELLPHAAADTEHLSRVDGAKQAVDQIFDAIQYKKVTNLKGDLPEGYTSSGAKTVAGVGKVTQQRLATAADSPETSAELRRLAEEAAALWGAIDAIDEPARREELISRYGADLIKASNRYAEMMSRLGLQGPYSS
ncbi:MAG: NAD(P)-dependent oxidoreductase, partial [Pseudomonadota bacterium]